MTKPLTFDSPFEDPCNLIVGAKSGVCLVDPKHLDVIAQMPLPGITIFVHGVNSDGEWYTQTEEGICNGLNDRLKRNKGQIVHATPEGGQLTPAKYMEELTPDGFINPEMNPNSFVDSTGSFSPVIHFRWGYKASSKELQLFGDQIYLNEENYWGGGPFANGCTSLPDLWGDGIDDTLFLWLHVQHMNPTNDRVVYSCPPRPYYVLAALRLAKLVESIRKKQADTPITIVCHSQGNMIGIAAAFLGDRLDPVTDATGKTGNCVADTYVLCNPPYSLLQKNATQTWAERGMEDPEGRNGRTSGEARYKTLAAFFDIIRKQSAFEQPAATIDELMKNESYGFDARSDRNKHGYGDKLSTLGRVTLYFNPHDQVISSSTIQGIGWRGLSQQEINATNGHGVFSQRVFAQGFKVGEQGQYGFAQAMKDRNLKEFWHPPSPVAKYSLSKGLAANTNIFGKVMTIVSAPVMIVATTAARTRINGDPPKDWKTPLTAPNLPESFLPEVIRFGQKCADFDQGYDAPGESRDKERVRDADDPYSGDRTIPRGGAESAARRRNDAAEGNAASEASLRYEHHAMLRMEAKREGMYANGQQVTEEDKPTTASAEYNVWRNKKIKENLAKSIDTHATDHSTIMTNGMHAQKALAYDVAVGACFIKDEDFNDLRMAADWRFLAGLGKNDPNKVFEEYFKSGLFREQPVNKWANETPEGKMPVKIVNQRGFFAKVPKGAQ
ncbi:T6SS effector phospholipase Tle3 domain-containing protein [Massilia eburnea]|uniref:T6SS effector phospholipase Tle3 domain-containing protein n=1 Tax=Massilia eburnea TaxID=1776165 RepID=UPI003D6B0A3D